MHIPFVGPAALFTIFGLVATVIFPPVGIPILLVALFFNGASLLSFAAARQDRAENKLLRERQEVSIAAKSFHS